MATWLATSRVFCFRAPLSGDRDDCSVVCCRPGSLVTFWTRQRRSVPRLSHPGGVPAAAWHLPNSVAGEVTSPTAHHRSSVRVRRKVRPSGTPQASLCRSGRLKSRAMPTERTLRAKPEQWRNVQLRDMNIPVSSTDERPWDCHWAHSWPLTSLCGQR